MSSAAQSCAGSGQGSFPRIFQIQGYTKYFFMLKRLLYSYDYKPSHETNIAVIILLAARSGWITDDPGASTNLDRRGVFRSRFWCRNSAYCARTPQIRTGGRIGRLLAKRAGCPPGAPEPMPFSVGAQGANSYNPWIHRWVPLLKPPVRIPNLINYPASCRKLPYTRKHAIAAEVKE